MYSFYLRKIDMFYVSFLFIFAIIMIGDEDGYFI